MRLLALPAVAVAAFALAYADPAPPPAPPAEAVATPEVADLVAREKLRADVEAILADLETQAKNDSYLFDNTADRLLLLGPGVLPFLLNELDRLEPTTFTYAAYALGHLEGPGVVEGLRRAAERLGAEEENKLKRGMKAMALYALALHRVPDIVDLMLAGKQPVARMPWMESVPLLEVATAYGGRGAVLRLLERTEALRLDPAREHELLMAIRALAASDEPEVPAKLVSLLEEERRTVRIAALTGLGRVGDATVLDRVIAHLDADHVMERQAAADALGALRPVGKEKVLLGKLESEPDANVRGQLYKTLADIMGEGVLEAFVSHWGRPDPLDRLLLLRAATQLRSVKAANLYRAGLADKDVRVVTTAVNALTQLPGPGPADTLLALLRDPRETVSRDAVRVLASRREPRAGGRVADLLLQDLAVPRLSLGDRRDRLRVLGEALVDLQFTAVAEDLRKALDAEQDIEVKDYFLGVLRRLEALRANGDDRGKWAPLLESDDPGLRQLARVRLGALGGPQAARALTAAFGRDLEEDKLILGELGRTGSQEAAPLLERVLVEPAFDPIALRPLREGAAYGARLLGGPRMIDALRRSAERRQGRDGMVLVYYALAAGKDAVPLLRDLRTPSLSWYEWNRGKDLDRLDYVVRRLSAGLPIASLDASPESLAF